MRLRGLRTVGALRVVYVQFLIVVVPAFILVCISAGCTASEKSSGSGDSVSLSTEPKGFSSAGNEDAPGSVGGAGDSVDEDFELLEEEIAGKEIEVADPLEPVNRVMFFVNDTLYFWVFKPVSGFYKEVAPEPVRMGIRNFFRNLGTPIRFCNCLFQGKGDSAGTEFDRFVINSTAGILGFGDPARDKYGMEPVPEDLGQSLGVYGVGDGFYILLPVLGPSTLRDAAGRFGDSFLNPVYYVEPRETAIGITAGKVINESSFHIGEYDELKSEALDAYVAMRNAYIQYRRREIEQ